MLVNSIFCKILKNNENNCFALCNNFGFNFYLITNENINQESTITIFLYCHFQIAITIKFQYFGFTNYQDLLIFEKLQSISGIGCKYAEIILRKYYQNNLTINSLELFKSNLKIFNKVNNIFEKYYTK